MKAFKLMTPRQKIKFGLLGFVVFAGIGTLVFLHLTGKLRMRAEVSNPCEGQPNKVCNQATLTYSGGQPISSNWSEINLLKTITGTVKKADGSVFPGVTVQLCKYSGDFDGDCYSVISDKTTGSDGKYEVGEALSEGAYVLTFLAPGKKRSVNIHYLYIKPDRTYPSDYTLRDPTTDPIVYDGRTWYSDWNRNYDTPPVLPGATCVLKDAGGVKMTKTTDADGIFRAYNDDVGAGKLEYNKEYTIECSKSGYTQYDPFGGGLPKKITLQSAPKLSANNYELQFKDTTVGTSSLKVNLQNSSGGPIGYCNGCNWIITKNSTKHSLVSSVVTTNNLPAGDYTVNASGFGFCSNSANVTLVASQTTTANIKLSKSASISGKITMADLGEQIEANIDLLSPDGNTVLQSTNTVNIGITEKGYSFVENIPPGSYKVRATPTVLTDQYNSKTDDVTVTEGQNLTHDISLPRIGGMAASVSSIDILPSYQTSNYSQTADTTHFTAISDSIPITDTQNLDTKNLDKVQISLMDSVNKSVDIESRYTVNLKAKKIDYIIHGTQKVNESYKVQAKQNNKLIGEKNVDLAQKAAPASVGEAAKPVKKPWWQKALDYIKNVFSK